MNLDIHGKTFVITGGSAGIGLGVARCLLQEGANVVTCARGKDRLETAMHDADPSGERSLGVVMDATDPDAMEELCAVAAERFGQIDGLVNNVGTSLRGPFASLGDDDWTADFDLKMFPAIRLVRAALPGMLERHNGSIVNVLTVGGKQPRAESMPTSVTRAAGLAFTKALSKELTASGLRVNAVCVGTIRSAQHDQRWAESDSGLSLDEWYDRMVVERSVPMGRAGEPEEVGAAIAFLLSERASYISGTAVNVDGGEAVVL